MMLPSMFCLLVVGGPPPDVMYCQPAQQFAVCIARYPDAKEAKCWIADGATPKDNGVLLRMRRKKIQLEQEEWP